MQQIRKIIGLWMKVLRNNWTIYAFILIIICLCIISFRLYFFKKQLPPQLKFKPVTYLQLSHWRETDMSESLKAFQKSCVRIVKEQEDYIGTQAIPLKLTNIKPICFAALQIQKINASIARNFFEQWFQPVAVSNNGNKKGLFTGYYLSEIKASLHQHDQYQYPVYAKPKDLIMVNLGLFSKNLKGITLSGKVEDGVLYPYNISRIQIEQGVLRKLAQVLVWADNPIDPFFMEIQGSGFAKLDNGQYLLLGYAAKNSLPYTPIGKVLIQLGYLTKKNVSMQTIRAWLLSHPKQINSILNSNESYVFFKIIKGNAPLGAGKYPLTAGYSLAVDNHFIPLGVPLWLQTKIPSLGDANKLVSFYRLMIAQDTGGAIKNPVRGDIYWGSGEQAEFLAGHMQSDGVYFALLPRSFVNQQKPN